jgi:hypothetical protein
MKKNLLTIAALILTVVQVKAQGPTLNLVGGSPSLTKGTINTEVLTEIIQQKQEEVKKKVFRNTIVKGFNNSKYTESLRNFTTYHYLFNLMDVMTSGKNKTVITKSITESSTEFAYVFGLAYYVQQNLQKTTHTKSFGTLTISENIIEDAKVSYKSNAIKISDKVKDFNILIDLCYDIILNDANLQKIFKFKEDSKDNDFKVWYDSDNAFALEYSAANEARKAELTNLKAEVVIKLTELSSLVKVGNDIAATLNDLKTSSDAGLKAKANEILSSLSDLTGGEITAKINKINTDFAAVLTPAQKDAVTAVAGAINANYDSYKQLISFYSGLRKSNYKDFTLTKDQYYAMKFVITQFLDLAKNQYENDVVATVIDFMLENTLVEYADGADGTQKLEENSTNNDKGYLYIDIESLISAVNQKFSPTNRKGLGVYVLPFFSIGTNYASFTGTNSLTTDATGAAKSLSNLYFASEKIGIKWKIWNWQYTHSFGAGENFRYYNSKKTSRYWLRPQPKPTVSDIHLFAYGSGLLYNIANLKSTDNFNYAIAGAGIGMTFFNGLTANFSLACPFTDNKFYSNNTFLNLGFDIPIVEYIAGLRKK